MTAKKIVAADIARATAASAPPPLPPRMGRGFTMTPDGLRKAAKDEDAGGGMWICGPFEILTEARDAENSSWGLLLRWRDRDGRIHEEAIGRTLFAGDGGELRSRLADGGLTLNPRPEARSALIEYLSSAASPLRATTVPRIGWHQICGKRAFVLSDQVFGTIAERVVLQTPTREPSLFGQCGTLDGWKAEIAARCMGNSRLVLVVCAAFAAPLLDLLGEDGGGIHLFGKSRAGKTTLLRVAASVCGGTTDAGAGGFVRTWRATGNAIEGVAAAHSDALLPLDEIGQADGKDIGETAYLLGNGQGKARMDRGAGMRPPMRFRTLFLSTGEVTLAAKITESAKIMRAGMEVRMIDLSAEPQGNGVFETWPMDGSPEKMARALADAVRRHYGTPLRGFLAHLVALCESDADLADDMKREVQQRVDRWVGLAADGQVRTVCTRFALVAQAGLLATEAGLTGWPDGEVERAVAACFADWLTARGSVGAREEMQAIEQLRRFMAAHGSSRFEDWREPLPGANEGESLPPNERFRTVQRAGWRRWETDEHSRAGWRHYLTADGMKEALAGLEYRAALATLVKARLIWPGADGRSATAMTVTGYGKQRLYRINPAATSADPGDKAEAPSVGAGGSKSAPAV